jgi:hypothetical protein
MKLTEKQTELWKLAGAEMSKLAAAANSPVGGFMGGLRAVTRNPDKAIRDAAKTEGTREWALCTSQALASPLRDGDMTDEFCQRLIDIISA